ncbi:unnamed protein product [Durusdinium trenchii]|uniref:Uncharacterized protein n=1 Tax=Durusdinium trenchii TaxID=1381693 RepID=A0ABP0J0I4_9DINO
MLPSCRLKWTLKTSWLVEDVMVFHGVIFSAHVSPQVSRTECRTGPQGSPQVPPTREQRNALGATRLTLQTIMKAEQTRSFVEGLPGCRSTSMTVVQFRLIGPIGTPEAPSPTNSPPSPGARAHEGARSRRGA